eukprot:Opistho-2@57190
MASSAALATSAAASLASVASSLLSSALPSASHRPPPADGFPFATPLPPPPPPSFDDSGCPVPYCGINCTITYADDLGSIYYSYNYFILALMSGLFGLSALWLYRVIQWRGWRRRCRQRTILAHLLVSTFLMVIRNIDLQGWQGVYSEPVYHGMYGCSVACQYLLIFAVVHGMSVVSLTQAGRQREIVMMNRLYLASLVVVPPVIIALSVQIAFHSAWPWGTARLAFTIIITLIWAIINIACTVILYRFIFSSSRAFALSQGTIALGGDALEPGLDRITPTGGAEKSNFANPLRRFSIRQQNPPPVERSDSSGRRLSISQSGLVYSDRRASIQLQLQVPGGRTARHTFMLRKVFLFLAGSSLMGAVVVGMQAYVLVAYWLRNKYNNYPKPDKRELMWTILFQMAELMLIIFTFYFFRPLSEDDMRNKRNFAGKLLNTSASDGSVGRPDSKHQVRSDASAVNEEDEDPTDMRTSSISVSETSDVPLADVTRSRGVSVSLVGLDGRDLDPQEALVRRTNMRSAEKQSRLLSFIEEGGEEDEVDGGFFARMGIELPPSEPVQSPDSLNSSSAESDMRSLFLSRRRASADDSASGRRRSLGEILSFNRNGGERRGSSGDIERRRSSVGDVISRFVGSSSRLSRSNPDNLDSAPDPELSVVVE